MQFIYSDQIYTFEEFEELEDPNNTCFYSRASYDPVKELIDPSFDTWEKSCLCETPLNPDHLYIKCDQCEKWFHPGCFNIREEDVENITEFFCHKCKKQ